jgi:hypothetical protein
MNTWGSGPIVVDLRRVLRHYLLDHVAVPLVRGGRKRAEHEGLGVVAGDLDG